MYRVSRYHPRGRRAQWETLRMFYPAADLLRAYRDGQVDFEGLAKAYVEELDRVYAEQPELAQWVADAPGLGDFTLLCYERAGDLCHRLVLARWLGEKQPLLQVAEPLN